MTRFYGIAFLFILSLSSLSAQIINVNPDPKGPKWLAGGVPPLSKDGEERLNKLKRIDFGSAKKISPMPSSADNSINRYFRPIFNQKGNSCAQASGIGYIFTYEINRIRNRDGKDEKNWFPSHYAWHFINNGADMGSWPYQGWDIVTLMGCPTYDDFGGMDGGDPSYTKWMTDYTKYYTGMDNKVTGQQIIENCNTPFGLNNLKQYLYDYGLGRSVGGLASFSAHASGFIADTIRSGPHAGEVAIKKWGVGGAHMLTFVGYDDNIVCDVNGDGKITTDMDINKDGTVDIFDKEVGALKVANSWGDSWGSKGFCWMMYSVLQYDGQYNGGIDRNRVYTITVAEHDMPKQALRLRLAYTDRHRLTILVGVAQDTAASSPTHTFQIPIGKPASSASAARHPMRGRRDYEPIEMGFDISDLIDSISGNNNYKLFITFDHPSDKGEGLIKKVVLHDYTSSAKEYYCQEKEKPISGPGKTVLTIIKDGIGSPHEMNEPKLIASTTPRALSGTAMPITVVVEDQSKVETVIAHYTLSSGSNGNVSLALSSSQGNQYIFEGALPAQSDIVSGDCHFELVDIWGNKEITSKQPVQWHRNFLIHYDEDASDGVGTHLGDQYIVAIKLGKEELKQFYSKGYLTGIKYHMFDSAYTNWLDSLRLVMYTGSGETPEELIYTKDVMQSTQFDHWTSHFLQSPIQLEQGKHYWIGYKIDFRYGWFCGLDPKEAVEGKSNVIFHNNRWTTLGKAGLGFDGRWNIRALVESKDGIEYPKVESMSGGRAILNKKMPLSVTIYDNKGIASVKGVYSIVNGLSRSTDLTFSGNAGPFKVYTGTIDAYSYSCKGTVYYHITDDDNHVTLSNTAPIRWLSDKTINYDKDNETHLGGGGDTYMPVVKFDTEKLGPYYNDYVISGVSMALNGVRYDISAISSLVIKIFKTERNSADHPEEGDCIYSYDFTGELLPQHWHEHILTKFIDIEQNYDYWLAYDIQFGGGFFTGVSKGHTFDKRSCMVLRYGRWQTLQDWNHGDARWNLRGLVEKKVPITIGDKSKAPEFALRTTIKRGTQNRAILQLSLPNKSSVDISLYRIDGKRIRHCFVKDMQKGNHQLTIDLQGIASGMYLYKVSALDKQFSGKMLLKR